MVRTGLTIVPMLALGSCGFAPEPDHTCNAEPDPALAVLAPAAGEWVSEPADPDMVADPCVFIDTMGAPIMHSEIGCMFNPDSKSGIRDASPYVRSFGCRSFQFPLAVGKWTFDGEASSSPTLGAPVGKGVMLRDLQSTQTSVALSYALSGQRSRADLERRSIAVTLSFDYDAASDTLHLIQVGDPEGDAERGEWTLVRR